MKTLGLFLFTLSFSLSSWASDSLILRAHVPLTYRVQVDYSSLEPQVRLISNGKKRLTQPQLEIHKKENVYFVSVIHP